MKKENISPKFFLVLIVFSAFTLGTHAQESKNLKFDRSGKIKYIKFDEDGKAGKWDSPSTSNEFFFIILGLEDNRRNISEPTVLMNN
jgi:hypothetical protein